MNEQIKKIVDKIHALEEEMRAILYAQQSQFSYKIAGKRVEFEKSIREVHERLKMSWFYWFITISPKHLVSGPFIYGLIIPLLVFDIGVSVFQSVCFRLYGISRVKRSDYIVFDHQHLAYLNIFEKSHCLYCSYATGLINYGREIASRTEQYWCPIKHAHKMIDTHHRYADFLDYGNAENYQDNLVKIRTGLQKEK
ncbi:MAG: hypothetical protein OQK95_13925 [Gammaproteobacteria bacterium]|nr:hypothetical protein [Gammaproteobacteria bacterium]MCW9031514.1 hypothetical protein [Gammaproteobacteria bacterium]